MASFIDIPYLSAYQQATQPVDVLANVAKGFAFGDEMPWSVRRQRKEAIENHQLMMQQQRFQAEMQDRARQNQIQEMLLPYKIQQAQRLANPYGGQQSEEALALDYARRIQEAQMGAQPTQLPSPVEVPLPELGENEIPSTLPVQQPAQNISFDAPAF